MKVVSRKSARVTTLEFRERRILEEAHAILLELNDLTDDQRAEEAATLVGIIRQVYSPPPKGEAT